MGSPIAVVDVDRCETWTRYKNGLCDTCAANCCTMPVEVKIVESHPKLRQFLSFTR